jgi:hypothetical protein
MPSIQQILTVIITDIGCLHFLEWDEVTQSVSPVLDLFLFSPYAQEKGPVATTLC